ncbi:hypothetical protein PUV47_01625 [Pseudovibrio exalbescens]|uniref:hypothetical protein n=1 Tax=Pseudovibrio exalbescens TaxID=197461 RepID=UPI002365E0E7|nr:hypothetical protein [Pseudovibrio exalbescens]MDD7908602.1 hypothetical protein [Pseudovibrio exalbescens]
MSFDWQLEISAENKPASKDQTLLVAPALTVDIESLQKRLATPKAASTPPTSPLEKWFPYAYRS